MTISSNCVNKMDSLNKKNPLICYDFIVINLILYNI